jgi:hypothetical protein
MWMWKGEEDDVLRQSAVTGSVACLSLWRRWLCHLVRREMRGLGVYYIIRIWSDELVQSTMNWIHGYACRPSTSGQHHSNHEQSNHTFSEVRLTHPQCSKYFRISPQNGQYVRGLKAKADKRHSTWMDQQSDAIGDSIPNAMHRLTRNCGL